MGARGATGPSSNPAAPFYSASVLAAAGVGGTAAFAAGSLGAPSFGLLLASLGLGYGRGRAWAISRVVEKPRLFALLSAFYIPLFLIDLVVTSRSNPVHALVRLVVFLLAAEALSGTAKRAHRPLLLGLLLLVSAASETTELWFALPLVAFAVAATASLMRTTLLQHQPVGAAAPTRLAATIATIVTGSLLMGVVCFFAIPRVGTGWGRQLAGIQVGGPLETGLTDSVSLGSVGRVKKKRTVAFLARIRGARFDPETVYWRARTYSRWTGEGWSQDEGERGVVLILQGGRTTHLPGEARHEDSSSDEVRVEIETKTTRSAALASPGRPVWLRTPRDARVKIELDGNLSGQEGAPRQYEMGLRSGAPSPSSTEDGRPVRPSPQDISIDAEPRTSRSRASGDPRVPRASHTPEDSKPDPRGSSILVTSDGPTEPARIGGAGPSSELEAVLGDDPRPFPGDPDESAMRSAYLDLGPVDGETAAWALKVGPEQVGPESIARAFVADLSRRPYSLDTGAIDPRRPIASFLGGAPAHCEYFASAMALGLRVRGIAARVVGGYLGADVEGDELIVRESRAHLWVEAYSPGVGWIRYDPTPEAGRVPPASWLFSWRDGWESVVRAWDGAVIGLTLGDQGDFLIRLKETAGMIGRGVVRLTPWLAATLVAFALLLGVARLLGRRGPSASVPGIPKVYRRFLFLAARRGFHASPIETAREFALRAGRGLGDLEAAWTISVLYERQRFGGHPSTGKDDRAAAEALMRLRAGRPQGG